MIDVHAHFYTERSSRPDWKRLNERRLEVGSQMGIKIHVASILGTWGATSPTYFPSRDDVTHGNDAMAAISRASNGKVRGYCVVNPNFTEHALQELERGFDAGLVGVKLAASRRANDPLLNPIAEFAAGRGAPVLHHIWQHRRREWPGQEASDAAELAELAARHLNVNFILAHIGGGGDWTHSLRVVQSTPNIYVDLSGSGVDMGMIEGVLESAGVDRTVWGCDVTLDTGLAKLRYLDALGVSAEEREKITSGNARKIFPDGAFAA